MTAAIVADLLVCGDQAGADHQPGCTLGQAETIAAEAATAAAAAGGNGLLAALTALAEAGILADVPDPDTDSDEMLLGILDELWLCGLIVAARPRLAIVRPQAAGRATATRCNECGRDTSVAMHALGCRSQGGLVAAQTATRIRPGGGY